MKTNNLHFEHFYKILVDLDISKLQQISFWTFLINILVDLDISKLQHLLQSKYALQFSVIYDVERLDKGGEVQVSVRTPVLPNQENTNLATLSWQFRSDVHVPTFLFCFKRWL